MNILYINHYAGSLKYGMEFRPFYMSREWIKQGHNVTLIAASHSHVRSKQPEISGTFTEEINDGIKYIWCKTPHYQSNGIKRFINMLIFIFRVFQYVNCLKNEKPNVVIASSTYPLDIFPAKYIAWKYNAKLLFEVHDLWPLSPIELGGMKKTHPFIIFMQMAEDFAYKYSDKVISMLPKTLEYMESRGMNPSKFVYIPNGIDLDEWKSDYSIDEFNINVKTLAEKINNDQKNQIFTIAYLGTHGLANALSNFLKAAKILEKEKIHFYLIGNGPDKKDLIKMSEELNLKNTFFIDPIPKNSIPLITKLFDANYIGLQKQSLFRFGISPNKLMDYMAAARPIINAIEAGNDPVKEAKCGFSVPAENPNKLANAILNLKNLDPNERIKFGKNGNEYVTKEHDYKVLSQKFLKAMM